MSPSSGRLDQAELDELWDFADPAGSQRRLRAAAEAAADPIRAAELSTQIARAVGLQDRFDEAGSLLDAVQLDTVNAAEPVVAARLGLERGRLLNSAGRPEDAVPWFVDALTAAEGADAVFLAVDAAHMLAIADPQRSQQWTRRGLDLVDGSADPRVGRWRGALHNNLGWDLHDQSRFPDALTHFEAALDAYRATGTAEQVRIARWTVARGLRSVERLDEALAIQQDLKANGPPDVYVDEELAELRRLVDSRVDSVGPDPEGPA